jgi:hypothetical protein
MTDELLSVPKRININLPPDATKEEVLTALKREKANLDQIDLRESIYKARDAVASLKFRVSAKGGQVENKPEVKRQASNMNKRLMEEKSEAWVKENQDFKDFIKTIKEKEQIDPKKLDMSYGNITLGPTLSQDLLARLSLSLPAVERAIGYTEEIISIFDERLKILESEEAKIPSWSKQAEDASKSARKLTEKINTLVMEARECKRTDGIKEAEEKLRKAVPLVKKYRTLDLEYSQNAAHLAEHSVQLPYFPPILRSDDLERLLRAETGKESK